MRTDWNEPDRVAALHRYDILDSPSEAIFIDFARIAAMICDTPIAVVNLIDANRQWFAAEIGLGVRETPLNVSICAHAILQPDVFVIPDLMLDDRFDCNPLVTGHPNLRFYGGALLESPEGLPLGTMCVLDYKPRPDGLTEQQTFMLTALARQVMTQLELRRALAEKELMLQEAHHRVKNSLAMVQSLLSMQARAAANPEAAAQLRESAGRIHAFGLMHEHLYRVGAGTRVDLAEYLGRLVQEQRTALASTFENREIAFDAVGAEWPSHNAPSVGLILMELVTNSLKYGAGRIAVSLRLYGREIRLTVEDEGQGLPANFEPSASKGLGMRVLLGLLRGPGNRLEVDRTRGHTCFIATLLVPPVR